MRQSATPLKAKREAILRQSGRVVSQSECKGAISLYVRGAPSVSFVCPNYLHLLLADAEHFAFRPRQRHCEQTPVTKMITFPDAKVEPDVLGDVRMLKHAGLNAIFGDGAIEFHASSEKPKAGKRAIMDINQLNRSASWLGVSAVCLLLHLSTAYAADVINLRSVVDRVVQPLMLAHKIPGMAVAITVDGHSHVFNYGQAIRYGGLPVDDRTLFEIGSLSKAFTGTLGAFVIAKGNLTLSDPAAKALPELAGTGFDRISLLDLATYTAGGLPLQFPDTVTDEPRMFDFYRNWRPSFPPGTKRLYANTSIGLFGYAAARSEGISFEALMTKTFLPKFGLSNTYLTVPEEEMGRYALGTSIEDRPARVSPGMLDDEAYGIKTTASDMIRFVELSMNPSSLDATLRAAIVAAQIGYIRYGKTMQGLGWEIYDRPESLETVLAGNAPSVTMEPQPAEKLDPPQAPRPDRFVNKTGSTNGFGAYAAFMPEKRLGIAILANRNYPSPDRVTAAWTILSAIK